MRAVNLLPRDGDAQGRKVPPVPVLVACVGSVLVSVLLAVMFLSASKGVAQKQADLRDAQAAYAAIPAPPPPSPVVAAIPQLRQTRVTALATALGQRIAWDRLLREVSQVVPSDVWLVTLNAQAPSNAPPARGSTTSAAPAGFNLTGCTYSQDSVARFLARLQLIPDLSVMTLGKSSAGTTSTGSDTGSCPQKMVTFVLTGNVRAPGATS